MAKPTRPIKTERAGFVLSIEDKNILKALSFERDASQSTVLRELIREAGKKLKVKPVATAK